MKQEHLNGDQLSEKAIQHMVVFARFIAKEYTGNDDEATRVRWVETLGGA